ncbi:hypothetical protein [Natronorarus salvus]|uniref:hypothetical protein n=1 Tax=Natronorarus salvus TaxID=3117733 RepID=UPI002F2699C5
MTGTGERMGDISHTHPYDDTSAGELFLRGPVIVADGGRDPEREDVREAETEAAVESDSGPETMAEVSHTPPEGDGANRVFERGEEHEGSVGR